MTSPRYSLFLVPFPFNNLQSEKVRPVLALTDPIGVYEEIIVAFITTQIPEKLLSSDLSFQDDFGKYGLKESSILRIHKITSLPKSSFLRYLGTLDFEKRALVKQKLQNMLDI